MMLSYNVIKFRMLTLVQVECIDSLLTLNIKCLINIRYLTIDEHYSSLKYGKANCSFQGQIHLKTILDLFLQGKDPHLGYS